MRVLGIDPGTRITGYGIVDIVSGRLCHVDNGNIEPEKDLNLSHRLKVIFNHINGLIEKYRPDALAVESVFVAKNVRSSLLLGHARGMALVAAAGANIDVAEYSPSEVKKALVGTGSAGKGQVQRMVQIFLKLPEVPCEDASDALAVAICHCNTNSFNKRIGK